MLVAAIAASLVFTACATCGQGVEPQRRGPGTTGITLNRDAARDAEPTVLVDGRVRPHARVEVHAYRIVPNSFRPQLVWQPWLQERVGHAAGGPTGAAPTPGPAAGNPAAADYARLLGELLDPARLRELRTGS
jgi:hypothetical protein